MIITRKSSSSLPLLKINDHLLEQVYSFKYLGITITSNLSWSLHIQSVISKTHKITGLIYRSFYKYSSPYVLLKLYLALILPHFNYCSTVWSPPCNSINSGPKSRKGTILFS